MGFGFATVTPSATSVAQAGAAAVWTYPQRSLTDIQSLVNAIQNNDPSLLSSLSDILYVPAPFFAGQVSATQVAAFLDNLVLNYGLAGPVAAAIAASPYGLWSTNFVTQVVPYLSATTIVQVLFSGQIDANHAQLILYTLAQNYYYNKWINIVTANAGSTTISVNVTTVNPLFSQNLTIASGVTVTCGTTTCFFVAQSFNNYGTVVAYGAPGAPSPGTNIGGGGTGGGGIVIIAITAVPGTINIAGLPGGVGNSNASAAVNGGGGGNGVFYVVAGVAVPVGGSGAGSYAGANGVNGGGGGSGGYGSYIGGTGGVAIVYSFASANSMLTHVMQGLSDLWITEALGRAPSSVTPLAYMYGSGGGAGAGVSAAYPGGGGGGGGGGEVVIYGFYIGSGNINAVGGTGGGSPAYGGGGGGGGLVFVLYGATSGSVTANVNGGIGGDIGGTGLAGANGTAYIAAVTVNG